MSDHVETIAVDYPSLFAWRFPRRERSRSMYFTDEATGQDYEAKVFWDAGGMSFATYKMVTRGFHLLVHPISVKMEGGREVSKTVKSFSGYRMLVEERGRFSQKALDKLADQYLNPLNETVLMLTQRIIEFGGK